MFHGWHFAVGILTLALTACAPEIDAPPANPAISNQAAPTGSRTDLPSIVECDGPDEELRLLGGVCGDDTNLHSWRSTDGPGMALALGPDEGPHFFLFARVDKEPSSSENVAGKVAYSAFVLTRRGELEQWSLGEAVQSGTVVTFKAFFVACDISWVGQGEFLWRSTTIRFSWGAAQPC